MRLTSSLPSQRPRVLIFGPGPAQVGGVATFIEMLLSSSYLNEKYELIRLDTTRGLHGAGLASRFAFINMVYFIRQTIDFLGIMARSKPLILHIPITSFWAFWKAAAFIFMARAAGMKVVAHLHGGMFEHYYRESSAAIQDLIGRILHRTNVIIALSNRWKEFLLKEIRSDLNVEIVPNTVDPRFANAIKTINEKMNRAENIVLFVGELGYQKGVFDILRAVPLVLSHRADTRFIFAGKEETNDVWDEIKQVCVERELNVAVEFLGQVTGQAKLDLFLNATIFILPSYVENFPYVILEAMCTGLPIIATPVGAIPEVVEDGLNGFFIQPGDYHALAERILFLLQEPRLRHKMSLANASLIRNRYLPEISFYRFDQIYTHLIDSQ